MGGKSVAVTRGAMEDQELAKVAPANVDYKRFEDNNATIAAFVAGQTQTIATSAAVAGNMMQKNPQLGAEYKLLLKDSPCFVGIAKGEDALKAKVNEIIAAAKKDGTLDAMSKKYLGKEAGDLPSDIAPPWHRVRLRAVLGQWPLLVRGILWTLGSRSSPR